MKKSTAKKVIAISILAMSLSSLAVSLRTYFKVEENNSRLERQFPNYSQVLADAEVVMSNTIIDGKLKSVFLISGLPSGQQCTLSIYGKGYTFVEIQDNSYSHFFTSFGSHKLQFASNSPNEISALKLLDLEVVIDDLNNDGAISIKEVRLVSKSYNASKFEYYNR